MRGDYVVVPPNSARVEVCVRASLGKARAPGPEAYYWLEITLDFKTNQSHL